MLADCLCFCKMSFVLSRNVSALDSNGDKHDGRIFSCLDQKQIKVKSELKIRPVKTIKQTPVFILL